MDCRLLSNLFCSSVSPSNNSVAHLFQFTVLGPTPQLCTVKRGICVMDGVPRLQSGRLQAVSSLEGASENQSGEVTCLTWCTAFSDPCGLCAPSKHPGTIPHPVSPLCGFQSGSSLTPKCKVKTQMLASIKARVASWSPLGKKEKLACLIRD